jgi:hypothetical protein
MESTRRCKYQIKIYIQFQKTSLFFFASFFKNLNKNPKAMIVNEDLFILDPNEDDQGVYQCFSLDGTLIDEFNVTVVDGVRPKPTQTEKETKKNTVLTFKTSETVKLSCSLHGKFKGEYENWRRFGEVINT